MCNSKLRLTSAFLFIIFLVQSKDCFAFDRSIDQNRFNTYELANKNRSLSLETANQLTAVQLRGRSEADVDFVTGQNSTSLRHAGLITTLEFERKLGHSKTKLKFIKGRQGLYSLISIDVSPTAKLYFNAFDSAPPSANAFANVSSSSNRSCDDGNLSSTAKMARSLLQLSFSDLPASCETKKGEIQRAIASLSTAETNGKSKLQTCLGKFGWYEKKIGLINPLMDGSHVQHLTCSATDRSNFDESNATLNFGKEIDSSHADDYNTKVVLHELLHSAEIYGEHETDFIASCCLEGRAQSCSRVTEFSGFSELAAYSKSLKTFFNSRMDQDDVSDEERSNFLKSVTITIPADGDITEDPVPGFDSALAKICKEHRFAECGTLRETYIRDLKQSGRKFVALDKYIFTTISVDASDAIARAPAQPNAAPPADTSAPARLLAETPKFSESGASARDLRRQMENFDRSGRGLEQTASGYANALAVNVGLGSANATTTRVANLPRKFADGSSATQLEAFNPDGSTILKTGDNQYIKVAPVTFGQGSTIEISSLTSSDIARLRTSTSATTTITVPVPPTTTGRNSRGVSVPQRLARGGTAVSPDLGSTDPASTGGGITGATASTSTSTQSSRTANQPQSDTRAPAQQQQSLKLRLLNVDYGRYQDVQALYKEVARTNASASQSESIYFTYCGQDYFRAPGRVNYINLDNRNPGKQSICRGLPRLDAQSSPR